MEVEQRHPTSIEAIELRTKLGMLQRDIAKMVGKSRETIWRYENEEAPEEYLARLRDKVALLALASSVLSDYTANKEK